MKNHFFRRTSKKELEDKCKYFNVRAPSFVGGLFQKLLDLLRGWMSVFRGFSVIQGKLNFSEIKLNYRTRGCSPPKKKYLHTSWTVHPYVLCTG
jgi:hypothetical protein